MSSEIGQQNPLRIGTEATYGHIAAQNMQRTQQLYFEVSCRLFQGECLLQHQQSFVRFRFPRMRAYSAHFVASRLSLFRAVWRDLLCQSRQTAQDLFSPRVDLFTRNHPDARIQNPSESH